MSDLFLVVERRSVLTLGQDKVYSEFKLRGYNYREADFRKWVNEVWDVPLDAPLNAVVKACKVGGWRVFQLLGDDLV